MAAPSSPPSVSSRRDAATPLRPHPPLTRYYRSEQERRQRLARWFDATAPAYDWMTQLLSFGSGRWYRRQALERAGLAAGMRVLDVACGTGISTQPARGLAGDGAPVIGLDPSFGMLRQSRQRDGGLVTRAVAEALPFADQSFDFLAMGFALRHVPDLRQTFREFHRVLRPGGRLLILEITPPPSRLAGGCLKLYLRHLVPLAVRLGRGGRHRQELLEYYWDTIEGCVPPATILGELAAAGFAQPERHAELGIFSEYRARLQGD
ncbi:MAG TPA: class I SAM-dependent methyltransferase [Thermoanaerobaculia bacterium]|nr:class I SAM-dependent methyltransferase [Thermoanaerobaculia bacterium]